MLLTKYLYLFIYSHNGDGTFQVTGCYVQYPCTVQRLVSGYFSLNFLYRWSLYAIKSISDFVFIICLHYKYVNFICPFHTSALPVCSGVLRQEWIAHLRSTFSSCRYTWKCCVSTMTSTVGCSIFGLRPDRGLLVQLMVTTGWHTVTYRGA